MIKKILIFLFLIISIPILILVVYSYELSYHLDIKNKSDALITLKQIKIDNIIIPMNNISLLPKKNDINTSNPMSSYHYFFKAHNPKILTLIIKKESTTTDSILSCNLNDVEHAGCLFKVSIRNNNMLTCFCDSYADFS